MPIYHVG